MQNQEIKLTITLSEMKGDILITFPFDVRGHPSGPLKQAAKFLGQGIQQTIGAMADTIKSAKEQYPDVKSSECESTECILRLTRAGESFMVNLTPLTGFDELKHEKFKIFCAKIKEGVQLKLDEMYKKADGKSKQIISKKFSGFGVIEKLTDEQIKDGLWNQRN